VYDEFMAPRTVSRRDLQVLEQRRKQAAQLFGKGRMSQASVARELKVSRMSVSRWYRAWKKSGQRALRAAPRAGRKPLVNVRHMEKVQAALRQGARAHGFSADLWTFPPCSHGDRTSHRGALSPGSRLERCWARCSGACRSRSDRPGSETPNRSNTGRQRAGPS